MSKTAGILLCAWGKVGYGYAAFNMAASIRNLSPALPIALITDGHAIAHLSAEHKTVFSDIIVTGTVDDPGGFKANIYHRLPYDYTLYLDVDGLAINSVEPLLSKLISDYENDPETKYYRVHVYDWYDQNSPVDMPMMYWARRDDIWNHYGFTTERFPATQSSIQFIAKCDKAENFYKQLNHIYHNDCLPLESLKHQWGGSQPDELYLNVNIAKHGIDPHIGDVMWFCDNKSKAVFQLTNEGYTFISYFGVRQKIKAQFVNYYDREIPLMIRRMGFRFAAYKSHDIFSDKHANKFVSPRSKERMSLIHGAPLQLKADQEIYSATPGKKQIHLFTTYYQAANKARQDEIDECLKQNLNSPYIAKVFAISECDVPFTHEKLTVIKTAGRISMAGAVKIANENTGEINILCNSDIHVNDTIGQVQDVNLNNAVLCLSRWEQQPNGSLKHYNYEYSQDSWIWAGKLNIKGGDYNFGLLGCDNKFAHDLFDSGLTVYNPSRSIKTIHLHLSGVRHYSEATRLPRPYRNVPVVSLSGVPKIESTEKKKLLIHQPGKVGDILICLPIAKHYHDLGFEVHWMCPVSYHNLFKYVDYAVPVEKTDTRGFTKIIDLSFGIYQNTRLHQWWTRNRHNFPSFVHAKYHLAEVDVNKSRLLEYNRNIENENALFDTLIGSDDSDYILIHDNSDYGTPISVDSDSRIIRFEKIKEYSIFDWRKVIEKASEIHCIDSSLCNFVDAIKPSGKLFYYKTDRVPLQSDETILTANWERINMLNPEMA